MNPADVLAFRLAAAAAALFALAPGTGAQSPPPVEASGIVTSLRAGVPDDPSSGRLALGTREFIVPGSLRIDFPGESLTLDELFARAPAPCRARGESGLVPTDRCRSPRGDLRADEAAWRAETDATPRSYLDPTPREELPRTRARVIAARDESGRLVASSIAFSREDIPVTGAVTFINAQEGYLRINGALGIDEGGTLLRLNDPEGRQSIQAGRGCGEEGNGSPDARFGIDRREPSVRFEAGFAACVPGDANAACAADARPVAGFLDANALVPIARGDHISAHGGFEVHGGTRVFWAHTLIVHTSPVGTRR